jgi:hypothetical protein
VSDDGHYHRSEFRDTCRELGLGCGFVNARQGWADTFWPQGNVPHTYRSILNMLRRSLPVVGKQPAATRGRRDRKTPPSGRVAMRCGCPTARVVYVARSQVSRGAISCGVCQTPFITRMNDSAGADAPPTAALATSTSETA